jgi:hypothetical protein
VLGRFSILEHRIARDPTRTSFSRAGCPERHLTNPWRHTRAPPSGTALSCPMSSNPNLARRWEPRYYPYGLSNRIEIHPKPSGAMLKVWETVVQ